MVQDAKVIVVVNVKMVVLFVAEETVQKLAQMLALIHAAVNVMLLVE